MHACLDGTDQQHRQSTHLVILMPIRKWSSQLPSNRALCSAGCCNFTRFARSVSSSSSDASSPVSQNMQSEHSHMDQRFDAHLHVHDVDMQQNIMIHIATIRTRYWKTCNSAMLWHTGHVLYTSIIMFCRDLNVFVCVLTRTKVVQQAPFALNGVCPGLLLGELQQAQYALERHVAHWQQNQNLQQWGDKQTGQSSIDKRLQQDCRWVPSRRGSVGGLGKETALRVVVNHSRHNHQCNIEEPEE